MKIFALSDPHLGFGANKSMDIFGSRWEAHDKIIDANWRETVGQDDLVIMTGDISWAINYEELRPDFRFLDELPGRKLISRGNHDYWWTSARKNQNFCEENAFDSINFLSYEAEVQGGFFSDGRKLFICGSRGWINPLQSDWKSADEKYLNRELCRLKLAFESAEKKGRRPEDKLILCLHYPATGPNGEATPFSELAEEKRASLVIHGHVHGQSGAKYKNILKNGIRYINCAADALGFRPLDLDGFLLSEPGI